MKSKWNLIAMIAASLAGSPLADAIHNAAERRRLKSAIARRGYNRWSPGCGEARRRRPAEVTERLKAEAEMKRFDKGAKLTRDAIHRDRGYYRAHEAECHRFSATETLA